MGRSSMRAAALLLVVTALAYSQASEEVSALESFAAEQEDYLNESDDLMAAADGALREHEEVLMQLGEASPVVGLTRRIKHLQADIKKIRGKKKGLHKTIKSTHHSAAMASGAKRDKFMKEHITAGASDKNLDADLNRKNHELASLTIKQHAAAAAHASKNSKPPPAPKEPALDPVPVDSGASVDSSGLFDAWLQKWSTMRQSLTTMVGELTAHTQTQGCGAGAAHRCHHAHGDSPQGV